MKPETESPILVRVLDLDKPAKSSVLLFWGPGKGVGQAFAERKSDDNHTFHLTLDAPVMCALLSFLGFGREFCPSSDVSPQKIIEAHALSAWQKERGVRQEGFPALLQSREEVFKRIIEDKERYNVMVSAVKKAVAEEAMRFRNPEG